MGKKIGLPKGKTAKFDMNSFLQTPPKKIRDYDPKPPRVTWSQALKMAFPPFPKTPAKASSHFTEDKALFSNVFARLLASRPKTDITTRIILPKLLLHKIGFKDGKLTAVSHHEQLKGPRAYTSIYQDKLLPGNNRFTDKPRFLSLPFVEDYEAAKTAVGASDLEKLVSAYQPHGDVILALTGDEEPAKVTDAGVLQLPRSSFAGLELPTDLKSITRGQKDSGLALAASLYLHHYKSMHMLT